MRALDELIVEAAASGRLRLNLIKTQRGWQASAARDTSNAWSVSIDLDLVTAVRGALGGKPPEPDLGVFG
jgi:hypothetical protein